MYLVIKHVFKTQSVKNNEIIVKDVDGSDLKDHVNESLSELCKEQKEDLVLVTCSVFRNNGEKIDTVSYVSYKGKLKTVIDCLPKTLLEPWYNDKLIYIGFVVVVAIASAVGASLVGYVNQIFMW